jgi:CubicO group peptidase (beta-lactamase class C family)
MQNTYKARFLFLLSALFITSTAFSQNKAATIDSMIQRSNQLGLFNGSVMVVDHGKVIYKKAIGYADASKQVMLTDAYRFHIGSIAKEFNAVGIMMLKEQGKLSIDDKVSKYLPQLPAWAEKVSIKNLLQYASGLPDLKWKTIKNDAVAVDSLKRISKLDFEPGTKYAYNNSNTLLQRQVIEKITGMSFNDFVTEKMLKPLKMTRSIVDPDDNTPLMAKSYNNNFVPSPLISFISGWTATTLDDFYKWELSLENFKLISPASTLEILTPFAPNKQCGLGSGSMNNGKIATHHHDGTSLNYQALLTANPPINRTIILLTNNKQNNLSDINLAIEAILDGKPYQQPKKIVITTLQDKLETLNGSQILAAYNELKANHPQDYNFDNESMLNSVGYYLLNKKRVDDAILIFDYNVKLFPISGNLYDSLGEAYYNKGDKANALVNYKRAYELDPTNDAAKRIITELEK